MCAGARSELTRPESGASQQTPLTGLTPRPSPFVSLISRASSVHVEIW